MSVTPHADEVGEQRRQENPRPALVRESKGPSLGPEF